MSAATAQPISPAPGTATRDAENMTTRCAYRSVLRRRRRREHPAFLVAGPAWLRNRYRGVCRRSDLSRRAGPPLPRPGFPQHPLESADAIECVVALGRKGYCGFVQLMSSRGSAVLEHVKSIGEQHALQMLPVLKKPFETGAVLKILADLQLGIRRRLPRASISTRPCAKAGSSSGISRRSICAESS